MRERIKYLCERKKNGRRGEQREGGGPTRVDTSTRPTKNSDRVLLLLIILLVVPTTPPSQPSNSLLFHARNRDPFPIERSISFPFICIDNIARLVHHFLHGRNFNYRRTIFRIFSYTRRNYTGEERGKRILTDERAIWVFRRLLKRVTTRSACRNSRVIKRLPQFKGKLTDNGLKSTAC